MKNLFAGLTVLAVAGATFGAAGYYVYKKIQEIDELGYEDIIGEDEEEKAYEEEVYEAVEKAKECDLTADEACEETVCEESVCETEDSVEEPSVTEEVKEAVEDVKEAVEDVVDEITEEAEEKVDELRGAISDITDKAGEYVDTAMDIAEELGASVAEAAVKVVSDVKRIIAKHTDK